MTTRLCILIPAIKKNVAFIDDLSKKLDGITLIQRTIHKAKALSANKDIYVITDSQEISLICERNQLNVIYDNTLILSNKNIILDLSFIHTEIDDQYNSCLVLYPYTPLLSSQEIQKAHKEFLNIKCDLLLSVKKQKYKTFLQNSTSLSDTIFSDNSGQIITEIRGFLFFQRRLFINGIEGCNIVPYLIDEGVLEIQNYHDWWVCEKLLRRKKIVFRVIGNQRVGMGHIYRALSMAHEITDHEISFICDEQSELVVPAIARKDYQVIVEPLESMEEKIIALNPDMVVNDILNSEKQYIQNLKKHGIKVVNFEDLGSGAEFADITFNELYDTPVLPGSNIYWGHKFFCLRDEFTDATCRSFNRKISDILITFGGTDQGNLTLKVLEAVMKFCRLHAINIHIVCGPGYSFKEELAQYLSVCEYRDHIFYTDATGVISRHMEKVDLAISSNGRTVYELCHMNIPTIVISQNEREKTHTFACETNGSIQLNCYEKNKTEAELLKIFEKLVVDESYRKWLFNNMMNLNFSQNKHKVVLMIEKLFDEN